ncbi:sugar-binding transcriptional regulator [Sporanaerobacter sp.]|uniref:sugar-binding transcriptional regulator n=1 Tax=Sporanaerobacter sp. TaxID=2010183 RepID=UPI003A0FC840
MFLLNDLIELEKKIVPEIVDILEKRYDILRSIYLCQPIGRRALATQLNIGERTIRTEVAILKDQGLLNIESMGMYVTEDGKNVLEDLKDIIHNLKGLSDLEMSLEKILGVKKVIIVPGNSDEDELVLKDMGRAAAKYLRSVISSNSVIGITGGTTMAQVAEEMCQEKKGSDVLVLPARGGLGKNVEIQANSIAAKLAQKLGGNYRLLHVPDNIEEETITALLKVPEVNEFVNIMKNINVLVFGMGRADEMAKKRKSSEEKIEELIQKGAVAEAFGHYFDRYGNTVWESMTVGLSLVDFKKVDNVIGVAGGERKAEAIVSICSIKEDMVLVTDEGAAKKILDIVN